jgi:nitrogen regulatory protein P-II 1
LEYRKITAIVRTWSLKKVERELEKLGVHLSVSYIKGRGEFANLLSPSELDSYARLEIFTESGRAEEIVASIMDAASSGMPGDGIVAVLPVERVYRIRTKTLAARGAL